MNREQTESGQSASPERASGVQPAGQVKGVRRAGLPGFLRDALPFIAATLLMLVFVTLSSAPEDNTADASLFGILNHARQENTQFGTDLVYTYGPLGYLLFPYYSPYAATLRIVVNGVFSYAVAAGLCLAAWRLRLFWRGLLLWAFAWATANIPLRVDLLVNTGLLCWGLLCFVEDGRRLKLSVFVFTLFALFCALAKNSFLFVGSLSVVLCAAGLLSRHQPKLAAATIAGYFGGFVAGWCILGQKLSHLAPMLRNTLSMVQGYNAALGWEAFDLESQTGVLILVFLAPAVMLRALTAFDSRERFVHWRRLLLLAFLASLNLSVWKHGFVRAHVCNVVMCYGWVAVLALVLEILPRSKSSTNSQSTPMSQGGKLAHASARVLGTAACLTSLISLQLLFYAPVLDCLQQPFRMFAYHLNCLTRPGDYRRRMNEVMAGNYQEANLPKLKEIIGREKVDVFGRRQAYALLNGLSYVPRPVPQSYAVCNASLMRLNEDFYRSQAAPKYVLFELDVFERKLPALEDGWVLRHLLINYQPVAVEGRFLLLELKASEAARLTLLREGMVKPGEMIDLTDFGDADLWVEISVEPTLAERLRQFFVRPSVVRVACWRQPGKDLLVRNRAPPSMLAAGFIASPLLQVTSDVLNLYAGKAVTRPGAYSVELPKGQEVSWRERIRFRIYRIENQLGRFVPKEFTEKWPPPLR
jgi:hypothetical protein